MSQSHYLAGPSSDDQVHQRKTVRSIKEGNKISRSNMLSYEEGQLGRTIKPTQFLSYQQTESKKSRKKKKSSTAKKKSSTAKKKILNSDIIKVTKDMDPKQNTMFKNFVKSWENFFCIPSKRNNQTIGDYSHCFFEKLQQYVNTEDDIDFANR